MTETETENIETTPNARQIAGMTAERRILWLRILLRQKAAVRREHGRIEKELKADFEASLAAPVDTDPKHHKANIDRLIRLQELEAKIENNKSLRAQKVAKVEGAFEAILFPKDGDGSSQIEIFGSRPVMHLDPEVAATLQTALQVAKASTEDAASHADEKGEKDGKKSKADEWGHESIDDLLACERELADFMAEMGVAEITDPLSAAESELDDEEEQRVVKMPPRRRRTEH